MPFWKTRTRKAPPPPARRRPLRPRVEALEDRCLLSTLPATLPDGIASGDTTQTSTVLWAHSTAPGPVTFTYATDPTLKTGPHALRASVTDPTVPVKVQVTGLQPDTEYFYRVTDAAGASLAGRFHTAAAPGAHPGLRFGVGGDWAGALSPYPALANAAGRGLDFFVEDGNTAYADVPLPPPGHPDTAMADFRATQAEVYAAHFGQDNLAALRASTSVLATLGGSEVGGNFAGGAAPSSDPRFGNTGTFLNQTSLYKDGVEAFQEYNPVQNRFYGSTGDPRTAHAPDLFRFTTYGSDAAAFVLDGRSFRDAAVPDANPTDPAQVKAFLAGSGGAGRTLLGARQLADLEQGLLKAQAAGITWKFIVLPDPVQNLGVLLAAGRYEGYAAERAALLRFLTTNHITNAVFVAAGLDGLSVNNLTYQDRPAGPQVHTGAFEVAVPGVGNPSPLGPAVVDAAVQAGALTPAQQAFYDALPVAAKDAFVQNLIETGMDRLGYDPIGLQGSEIAARLLQGGYFAAHDFGWTEFAIDPATQQLTVTTYGVDLYSYADLTAHPEQITHLAPKVISRFVVTPQSPVPVLQGLSRSAAPEGSPAVPLTVYGSNFVPGSTVNWNGTPVATTYVSATQLRAVVPAADLAEEGGYPVTVVNPSPGGGPSGPKAFAVGDAPQRLAGARDVPATEGNATGALTVGRFTDPGADGTAADYTATIDWGDGQTSPGTVVAGPGGGFAVQGAHAYAAAGKYLAVVRVTDKGGSRADAFVTVRVDDAPLTALGRLVPMTPGVTAAPVVVASFTDANPLARAADFLALIDWGDGVISTGLVRADPAGRLDVLGTHRYAGTQARAIKVVIQDDGGGRATALSTAVLNGVTDPPARRT